MTSSYLDLKWEKFREFSMILFFEAVRCGISVVQCLQETIAPVPARQETLAHYL